MNIVMRRSKPLNMQDVIPLGIAAELLQVNRATVQRWIDIGYLPAIDVARNLHDKTANETRCFLNVRDCVIFAVKNHRPFTEDMIDTKVKLSQFDSIKPNKPHHCYVWNGSLSVPRKVADNITDVSLPELYRFAECDPYAGFCFQWHVHITPLLIDELNNINPKFHFTIWGITRHHSLIPDDGNMFDKTFENIEQLKIHMSTD